MAKLYTKEEHIEVLKQAEEIGAEAAAQRLGIRRRYNLRLESQGQK
jgi:hypothetical protein